MKNSTKHLVLAGLMTAIGVVSSTFYIPFGVAKCFPVQHLINVLAAVLLGPAYAVGMAFSTSLIRNLMGTGSLLAFPGSMIGAFLAAWLFKRTKKTMMAFIGEVIGTGVLGSLCAYPVAAFILGKEVALFTFVIPFGISTLVGSVVAYGVLLALKPALKLGAIGTVSK